MPLVDRSSEFSEPAPEVDDVESVLREHHLELLRFFQARLKQPQDAADLVQESCARLLKYREGHTRDSLRLLLFRIARNLLNDYWRWNQIHGVEVPTDLDGMAVESEQPTQERQLAGQQRLARLEEVVLGLSKKCRTVFLLSRIEELTNAQVASRCGISIKMVEKHLARALMELRLKVGDD